MKHFYTTKDIKRIFGIGRETLRHYENLGLLQPHVNPENRYREYGYWDIGTLVDIIKFRAIGLSLKETKRAIFEMDFPELLDTIDGQCDFYERKVKEYELLLKKSKKQAEYLSLSREHLGKAFEMDMDGIAMVPYLYHPGSEYLPAIHKVFQNFQFFETGWCFHGNESGEDPIRGMGFFTPKEYAEYIDISNIVDIPPARVIAQVIDICGKVPLNETHLEDFEREMADKYEHLSEETYVLLGCRFYDKEKRYHQYLLVFKQIR